MKTISVCAVLSALTTLAACGVDPSAGEPGSGIVTSDDELRAPSAAEIVGDIGYGETKTVSYTEVPTFRAFRLAGKEGCIRARARVASAPP